MTDKAFERTKEVKREIDKSVNWRMSAMKQNSIY